MHLLQGSITVDGTFAYVSQQAWIFHGTVQENILMGEPFDQSKYMYIDNVTQIHYKQRWLVEFIFVIYILYILFIYIYIYNIIIFCKIGDGGHRWVVERSL